MIGLIAALGAGLVFGVGLGLAGMLQPAKVAGFLDFFGDWDPTLGFVMAGAIAVHATARWFILRRASPAHAAGRVDSPLLIGAAVFGIGWGLGGYCPGPAVVSTASLTTPALAFFGAMLAGMLFLDRLRAIGRSAPPTPRGAEDHGDADG